MQLYAEPTELTAQVSALLAGEAAPSSAALLQLALLCLQTGHPHQAARLRRSGQLIAEHQAELENLERSDPLSLYSSWKAAATGGWQTALSPDAQLRLGLLLSSCQDDALTRLRSDLQELFGEAMVQADLLQAEQLELCHHHLETAPTAERRSISLLDVEARLRLQQQFVQEALRCWDAAIEQARAERYAIPLPDPSSASERPDPQGPPAHGS
jgi:hypothetical protein